MKKKQTELCDQECRGYHQEMFNTVGDLAPSLRVAADLLFQYGASAFEKSDKHWHKRANIHYRDLDAIARLIQNAHERLEKLLEDDERAAETTKAA